MQTLLILRSMLLWFLLFSVLGDSSWDKSQVKQRSDRLQDLLGNISKIKENPIPITSCSTDVSKVVSRENWTKYALNCSTQLARPVRFLIIHHIPGLDCDNKTLCSQRLRDLQMYHVHNNSRCDVAYNFLVGDDGRAYEGVGWGIQGMHTQGYNNISLGFAFFGTKSGHSPSPDALSAMEGLISSAILKGHLSPIYHQPLLVKGENCLAPKQKTSPMKVCPDIVPRSVWGARETKCPKLTLPAKYAIIIQTAGRTCNMSDECRLLAQDIQSLLMDKYGTCDTSYNFLVGQDGAIYEGVGWNVQGYHTPGYNDIALGIAFMGTFSGTAPNAAALDAAQNLIQCAVAKGYLIPNYLLVGQSDLMSTLSPGQALYNIIKSWPHFKH
ncbi:peptidoglycan recognition protein 4 [Suncus etruscus]|uniref:peptidoglycan recognition protein 4 n=1 Tax=Suncus etruscus TaxID=109475 RepID=UPI00210FEE81|nr:peptidoglycan recognition protein 4 [Suncus etruscus]